MWQRGKHSSNKRPVHKMISGASVIKPFTMVVYHHSMALLSSCVIKHYYHVKYYRMTVNNPDKCFITLAQGGRNKNHGNLPQHFNRRKSRIKNTMVIYRGIVL
jgi:hypothetical protein